MQRDDAEVQFWLSPVRFAWNKGFSGTELRKIEKMTQDDEYQLIEFWNEYFNS